MKLFYHGLQVCGLSTGLVNLLLAGREFEKEKGLQDWLRSLLPVFLGIHFIFFSRTDFKLRRLSRTRRPTSWLRWEWVSGWEAGGTPVPF